MGKSDDEIRLAELEEKVSGMRDDLGEVMADMVELGSRVVDLEGVVSRLSALRG